MRTYLVYYADPHQPFFRVLLIGQVEAKNPSQALEAAKELCPLPMIEEERKFVQPPDRRYW